MQRCATARAGGRGVLRAARLSPRVVKRSGDGAGRVGVGASDGLTATGLHHVGVLCKDVKVRLATPALGCRPRLRAALLLHMACGPGGAQHLGLSL